MGAALNAISRLLWLDLEGSTRLFGLMRIALVLLLWSTWATPFIVHFDMHMPRVALSLGFYLSSVPLLVGLGTRWVAPFMAAVLIASSVLLGQGDPSSIWLTQERQLATLAAVLLALAPSGRSLSVDRLLALRRVKRVGAPLPDERGPLWSLRLIQLCAAGILLTTVVGQLSSEWLSGSAVAWGLLGINLVGLFGVWWRRTRVVALAVVCLGYLGLYPFMLVGVIGMTVTWLLASFLTAQGVHRALDRLHGHAAN